MKRKPIQAENIQEAEVIEEKAITVKNPTDLQKPENDTKFAREAAKLLVAIVKQNNWARRLGGQSEHLQYEAWQTLGKYYGYTVRTGEAIPVEVSGVAGFKATAKVVNEVTGIEVGGAEAYCLKDEFNWKSKPLFQLASMAQTRAGSKALRQILGFVVALAGYNPTPSEEMDEVHTTPSSSANTQAKATQGAENGNGVVTEPQIKFIQSLLQQKGYTETQLCTKYDVTSLSQLTKEQAHTVIENLMKLKEKPQHEDFDDADMDKIEKEIEEGQ